MINKKHLIYCFVSSILLASPWLGYIHGITIFFAFVPLLLLSEEISVLKPKNPSFNFFIYSSLSFLLWNILATGWLIHATIPGGIVIILTNTVIYSLVFTAVAFTANKFGNSAGFLAFVCYWTCFEGFYTNAEISWPLLNLGSGLIHITKYIQWYEFTGSLGGSVWILVINYIIFLIVKNIPLKINSSPSLYTFFLIMIIIPPSVSIYLYYNYKELKAPVNITILQPNIDPHTEKFSLLTQSKQLKILLELAKSKGNNKTDYFLGPETAIDNSIWENNPDISEPICTIRKFIDDYPNSCFITGATTYYRYSKNEKPSVTAQINKEGYYFDCFNTALLIPQKAPIQVYHKSKLVVGVEKTPYPQVFHFINNSIINLGGVSGNLGTQPTRTLFADTIKKIVIAPVICSESDYGEYVTGYILNGANIIFELTNDGWFGNSAEPDIHLGNACLRAIETRRSIARSANTGISASINQRGDIIEKLAWWNKGASNVILNTNDKLTFYVKHGDYIFSLTCLISFMLILMHFKNLFGKDTLIKY